MFRSRISRCGAIDGVKLERTGDHCLGKQKFRYGALYEARRLQMQRMVSRFPSEAIKM